MLLHFSIYYLSSNIYKIRSTIFFLLRLPAYFISNEQQLLVSLSFGLTQDIIKQVGWERNKTAMGIRNWWVKNNWAIKIACNLINTKVRTKTVLGETTLMGLHIFFWILLMVFMLFMACSSIF